MARHFREKGYILRFIEYMDVGSTNGWRLDDVVSAAEIINMINAELPLEAMDPNYIGEVAERWRYKDGGGEIGVIASVTQAFCGTCTELLIAVAAVRALRSRTTSLRRSRINFSVASICT